MTRRLGAPGRFYDDQKVAALWVLNRVEGAKWHL
jgi:hypothetical protein